MDAQTDEVVIADLGKQCSFDIGYYSTRTSQTCDRQATSVVLVTDAPRIGQPKWRCDEHEGMISRKERGEVLLAMPHQLAEELIGSNPAKLVRSWLDVPPHTEPY